VNVAATELTMVRVGTVLNSSLPRLPSCCLMTLCLFEAVTLMAQGSRLLLLRSSLGLHRLRGQDHTSELLRLALHLHRLDLSGVHSASAGAYASTCASAHASTGVHTSASAAHRSLVSTSVVVCVLMAREPTGCCTSASVSAAQVVAGFSTERRSAYIVANGVMRGSVGAITVVNTSTGVVMRMLVSREPTGRCARASVAAAQVVTSLSAERRSAYIVANGVMGGVGVHGAGLAAVTVIDTSVVMRTLVTRESASRCASACVATAQVVTGFSAERRSANVVANGVVRGVVAIAPLVASSTPIEGGAAHSGGSGAHNSFSSLTMRGGLVSVRIVDRAAGVAVGGVRLIVGVGSAGLLVVVVLLKKRHVVV